MKKRVFQCMMASLLLCLLACSKDSVLPDSEVHYPIVTVNFKLALRQEISPFKITKNMPGDLPDGPSTKNEENSPSDTPSGNEEATPASELNIIEYALYKNEDNSLVKHTRSVLTPNQDGSYSMSLQDGIRPGTYKICFIVHGIQNATMDESTGLMTFPTVQDTFWGNDELEVTAEEKDKSVTIDLSRAIAGIEFKPTDVVPQNAYKFSISSSGVYNTLSILDGTTTNQTVEIPYSYLFKSEDYTTDKPISHILYSFAPNEGHALLANMSFKTEEQSGTVLRQKLIESIPVYRNKITRYTGTLYTPNVTDTQFTISIDKNWGGYVEKDLDNL